jgi:hypothetical protein
MNGIDAAVNELLPSESSSSISPTPLPPTLTNLSQTLPHTTKSQKYKAKHKSN